MKEKRNWRFMRHEVSNMDPAGSDNGRHNFAIINAGALLILSETLPIGQICKGR